MWLERMQDPAADPVSLEEAKLHLRVPSSLTVEDDLIKSLVSMATETLDGRVGVLGRALMSQQWEWRFDRFPPSDCAIKVPFPPLVSVESLAYVDPDGVLQTAPPSLYQVDTQTTPGQVRLAYGQSWPSHRSEPYAVHLKFTAGHADAASVPAPIRSALLLMVGDAYRNRETIVLGSISGQIPMSTTVDALLAPWRMHWV